MSRWLRLYDDTINDPKVLKLPEALRWHWIALLCVASKNGGALPTLDDIAIQLRMTPAKATEILAKLAKSGLIDKTETGFVPHNWEGRQYKSDVSTDRVKRFRNSNRNVSVTPPETEAETETETNKVAALAPPKPAVVKKSRTRPKVQIVEGFLFSQKTREYAAKLGFSSQEIEREHLRFIRHAKQNDRRCADWEAAADNWFDKAAEFSGKPAPVDPSVEATIMNGKVHVKADTPQWQAWKAFLGHEKPQDRNFGWYFDSEWPPTKPKEPSTHHEGRA